MVSTMASTIKPALAEQYAEHVPHHRSLGQLERAAELLGESPRERGVLEMVIRRPTFGQREVVQVGQLDTRHGLVGDNWEARGSRATPDGAADPLRQITLMNSRALAAVAGDRDRWRLAGDQLIVDLDLSVDNLPAGTRLRIGEALTEVTEPPHTGCAKFAGRFGADALAWVAGPSGRQRRRRGMHVRVLVSGSVRPGDPICKLGQ
jgi:MOSC domain-containing protein YiiM